jgi:hypothetical protein
MIDFTRVETAQARAIRDELAAAAAVVARTDLAAKLELEAGIKMPASDRADRTAALKLLMQEQAR